MNNKKVYTVNSLMYYAIMILTGLITLDSFKNSFFLFQGGLGVLSVCMGVMSFVYDFKNKYISIRFKIYSLILLLIYCLIYSVINPDISIIFFVIGIISAAVLALSIVLKKKLEKKTTISETRHKKKYLKISIWLKLTVLANIVLLAIVWIYPFERYYNIFEGPNGDGLTTYVSETQSPKFSVNVDGGFVYNVSDGVPAYSDIAMEHGNSIGVLDIRLTEPQANISFIPFDEGKYVINLINLPYDECRVYVNDVETSLKLHDNNFLARSKDSSDQSIITDLINSSYQNSFKGYYFIIESDGKTTYEIDIIRNREEDDNWVFYSTSDTHAGINVVIPAFREILSESPDFVLLNGDIVNNGDKSEYMIMGEFFNSFNIPLYPVIGNHDAWGVGEKYYASFFGPYFYCFEYNNATFIMIDTSSGIIGNAQFEWLENQLQKANTDLIFIVSHIPPIDTVSGTFDSNMNLSPQSNHSIQSSAESERMLELCSKYAVDFYLAGHSHYYGETELNGTKYITSGVLGGTAKAANDIGYLKFNVSGDEVSYEFVDMSKYYNKGVLVLLQSIQVFLIPSLRGNSFGFLLTMAFLSIDFCLWVIFKEKNIIYV